MSYAFKVEDVEKVLVLVSHRGAKTFDNRSMPDINMQYMMSIMLLDGTATLEAAHDRPPERPLVEVPQIDDVRPHMPRFNTSPGVTALAARMGYYPNDEL